ncbi:MAG: hypothetical protein MI976_07700 [Pseudomonadales bacterium]|nr:hypothetical protein [Pseudomonadales bacterium]
MFEHENLDGKKYRLLPANESFINDSVLENRELKPGDSVEAVSRQQHGVTGSVLVERFLPPESKGDSWPHDAVSAPWWEVVGHPPHAGIVADFNAAMGGAYHRELKPDANVVAYAEKGEEVVMSKGTYSLTRGSDGKELAAQSMVALRSAYYTD